MSQHDRNGEHMLIAKAKNGNVEAFESLVKKYQHSIYYLCHRMTGAHPSADDLSQETFIKAYFALHRFKDGMNFFSWIRKIAVNNSLNYLKVIKREEPLGNKENNISMNSPSPVQELPQDKFRRNRLEEKFREVLKALPSDHRVVFILRVYENQSYKDISKILNIPHGTVMSRLNRARKKLRVLMAEYL